MKNYAHTKMTKEELIALVIRRMPEHEYTKAALLERERIKKELDDLKRNLGVETG